MATSADEGTRALVHVAGAATLAGVPGVAAASGVCSGLGNVGGCDVGRGSGGLEDGGRGGAASRGAATFAHELFGSYGAACVALAVATETPLLAVG